MNLHTLVADGQVRISVRLKERIIELSRAAAAMHVPRKLLVEIVPKS